jgi:Kef-type K+ transport system membrane component KefB
VPDPHTEPDVAASHKAGRVRLSRAEQRFNYGVAIAAVLLVVLLIVVSPQVVVAGQEVPVVISAVLLGAFLFGLGQMVIGLRRRRRYLRSLDAHVAHRPE